jgi:hypothetical protein
MPADAADVQLLGGKPLRRKHLAERPFSIHRWLLIFMHFTTIAALP